MRSAEAADGNLATDLLLCQEDCPTEHKSKQAGHQKSSSRRPFAYCGADAK